MIASVNTLNKQWSEYDGEFKENYIYSLFLTGFQEQYYTIIQLILNYYNFVTKGISLSFQLKWSCFIFFKSTTTARLTSIDAVDFGRELLQIE